MDLICSMGRTYVQVAFTSPHHRMNMPKWLCYHHDGFHVSSLISSATDASSFSLFPFPSGSVFYCWDVRRRNS